MYIAHQSFVFGTFYSRAFKDFSVGFNIEVFPVAGFHLQEVVVWIKRWCVVRTGKTVVWTGMLAGVAAVDALSQHKGCFFRDVAPVFDGQIRKASVGIEQAGSF